MPFFSQLGQPGLGGLGGGLGGSLGGGLGGGSPNPSAFAQPGMDPMTLALLLRMQSVGQPGSPGSGQAPGIGAPGGGNPAMPLGGPQMPMGAQPPMSGPPLQPPTPMVAPQPQGGLGAAGAPPGAGPPGQSAIAPLMQLLMSNPQMLAQLRAALGGGGGGGGV